MQSFGSICGSLCLLIHCIILSTHFNINLRQTLMKLCTHLLPHTLSVGIALRPRTFHGLLLAVAANLDQYDFGVIVHGEYVD